ncbi:DUF6270 domain-containing protein [Pseudobutyrivibrio xylanivorans]|uniref:Uncharacterized protein n=1 Tax=Pseudobutyrivibrio xylanivorans DSM 14809 TaxID=1123012 RepID=A0A1M6JAF9_PSEXY|nr:DUF6270 domain-containing protein [Pseudobutyrivibrio xylanivorans]SHJ43669.1 hypothetical protein SAMN02745725_02542 [Pseudobutyrivibrio xylanivorans DSM 14809]
MKNKINVGIIGACASRDAFNRRITPNYKDIFNVSCYDFQMSFASLMSPIIEYDALEYKENIKKVEYIERQHLYEDLNKCFLNELAVKQPDILIIDFYADVNFGFVELGDSYISNKLFKYEKSNYVSKLSFGKRYSGRNNFEEFFPIWKNSVKEFMKYCEKYIPNTTIVLNDFRLATYYHDKSSDEIRLIKENHSVEFIKNINNALEKCNNWFKENYNTEVIVLSDKEYFGNPRHIWGLDHLHLMPDFYSDFLWKLLDICLDKISVRTRKLLNLQLLQNGDFSREFAGWESKNTGWEIIHQNDNHYLTINKKDYTEAKNWQIWSEPFEVFNGSDDNKITISFEVRSEDWESIDGDGVFFCLRTFDKREQYNHKDSIEEQIFYKKNYPVEPNKWIKISYSFNMAGRFIRIAPYMKKNGSLQYKNISIVYGENPLEEWKPCINELPLGLGV